MKFVQTTIASIVALAHCASAHFVINGIDFDSREKFIQSGSRCGTPEEEDAPTNRRGIRGPRDLQNFDVTIPTVFHVIRNSAGEGNTRQDMQAQLDAMNVGFEGTGFQFASAGVTCTVNNDWFPLPRIGTAQDEMKAALRQGNEATLNLYFTNLEDGLLGYATFPTSYASAPTDDGVVNLFSTVPGGATTPFNEGDTAVHEIGHWLNLFHTFQGFLCFDGDGVDDTPNQRGPTSGCPERRNSCPLRRGLDPVLNFMDYSDDVCLSEFTPGQIERMQDAWIDFRDSGLEDAPLTTGTLIPPFSCS